MDAPTHEAESVPTTSNIPSQPSRRESASAAGKEYGDDDVFHYPPKVTIIKTERVKTMGIEENWFLVQLEYDANVRRRRPTAVFFSVRPFIPFAHSHFVVVRNRFGEFPLLERHY